jgi:hypothetical protein
VTSYRIASENISVANEENKEIFGLVNRVSEIGMTKKRYRFELHILSFRSGTYFGLSGMY